MSKKNIDKKLLPVHIGIIMDGNGRWAKKRFLPRKAGHSVGAEVFRKITRYCNQRGIKYLTVYAFSTENWKRPQEEVDAIMKLLREYLVESLEDFKNENIRTRFIGDITILDKDIQDLIMEAEKSTENATGLVLNIAMNYGGRAELLTAIRLIADDVKKGKLLSKNINEAEISKRLYTAGQPDPDLIIRPSGEFRTSNFLVWQAAYSEYWFSNILWPDYKPENLEDAFREYAKRNRRFGGI